MKNARDAVLIFSLVAVVWNHQLQLCQAETVAPNEQPAPTDTGAAGPPGADGTAAMVDMRMTTEMVVLTTKANVVTTRAVVVTTVPPQEPTTVPPLVTTQPPRVAVTTAAANSGNTTSANTLTCSVDKCVKDGNCTSTQSSANKTATNVTCTSYTGQCYVLFDLQTKESTLGCTQLSGTTQTTCASQFAVQTASNKCQFCCYGSNNCNTKRTYSDIQAMCVGISSNSNNEASSTLYKSQLGPAIALSMGAALWALKF